MISQIPNFLTLLRIGATPVLVLLLNDREYDLALLLFVLAGLSDGLDGYIAKRFGFVTRLGAILDPLADKMLIISTYIMLTVLGDIPFWLMVTVGFRDVLIVGGYLVLVSLDGDVDMHPSIVSKINTVVQLTLVIVVLAHKAEFWSLPLLINVSIVAVLATTVLSGAHYVWVWGIRRAGNVTPEQRVTDRPKGS